MCHFYEQKLSLSLSYYNTLILTLPIVLKLSTSPTPFQVGSCVWQSVAPAVAGDHLTAWRDSWRAGGGAAR